MKPKKIVIDARIIDTSTGRYIQRLLEHLQNLDTYNHYTVLLLGRNFDKWQPRAKNFHKRLADYPPYRIREQLGFAWALYRLRADLVHFTMFNHPILYFKKQVFTIHDLTLVSFKNIRSDNRWYYWIKQPAFRLTLWAAVKKASRIITPSKFVATQISQRYHASTKTQAIYEAADKLSAKPVALPKLSGYKFLLAVGNAYPYKNLWRLVEAFQELKSEYPKFKLVLVGKKDFFYQQLADKIKQRGISGVIITGWVSDSQLVWLYQNAEAYIFPSFSEGFGLPGLEAMYYGVPVLAARASCLPEIYGSAAGYFDPNSTGELTQQLKDLLASPGERQKLAKLGRARVAEFSWKAMAQATHKLYQQTLDQ